MTLPRSPIAFAKMVTLGPIVHDFTEPEVVVAKAGYDAYHEHKRPGHRRAWASLYRAEQFRWCLAAALVWQHDDVRADEIRARYHALSDVESWGDVPQEARNRWSDVASAMRHARFRLAAEERMVVSG